MKKPKCLWKPPFHLGYYHTTTPTTHRVLDKACPRCDDFLCVCVLGKPKPVVKDKNRVRTFKEIAERTLDYFTKPMEKFKPTDEIWSSWEIVRQIKRSLRAYPVRKGKRK